MDQNGYQRDCGRLAGWREALDALRELEARLAKG